MLKKTTPSLCGIISCERYPGLIMLAFRETQASPTLGCSIEISRDTVFVCMSVCLQKIRMPKCVGGITWPEHAHA